MSMIGMSRLTLLQLEKKDGNRSGRFPFPALFLVAKFIGNGRRHDEWQQVLPVLHHIYELQQVLPILHHIDEWQQVLPVLHHIYELANLPPDKPIPPPPPPPPPCTPPPCPPP
jgi:hypothetical protein